MAISSYEPLSDFEKGVLMKSKLANGKSHKQAKKEIGELVECLKRLKIKLHEVKS